MRQKKVCVLITTYNHEKFIAEAINSALMQKVNFDYDIEIIEDCSKDRTRDIVVEFQKNYPDKIRLVLEQSNQNSNKSWAKEIQNAQTPYIALLDGDDYWTSPHKLQNQVDFLDQHQECSICFHQAYNVYPDGRKVLYSQDVNYDFNKGMFTLEDILCQNFLPTCSVVFRQGLFEEFPTPFYDMLAADWFLHVLNARYGNIGYIHENWGVRRVHEGGAVSMKSDKEYLELRIATMNVMKRYVSPRYSMRVNETLLGYYRQVFRLMFQDKSFSRIARHVKGYLSLLCVSWCPVLSRFGDCRTVVSSK